jgi:hypothetical protein
MPDENTRLKQKIERESVQNSPSFGRKISIAAILRVIGT